MGLTTDSSKKNVSFKIISYFLYHSRKIKPSNKLQFKSWEYATVILHSNCQVIRLYSTAHKLHASLQWNSPMQSSRDHHNYFLLTEIVSCFNCMFSLTAYPSMCAVCIQNWYLMWTTLTDLGCHNSSAVWPKETICRAVNEQEPFHASHWQAECK